jgi:ADP-ribose pyrophosphatase YjhB (NUDIX family)
MPLDIQPLKPASGAWKKFDDARPYAAVNGFAYDSKGRFPIMFRSDKVRSAKNAWSMPSGLHETGYSLQQQFCIELEEELGLKPIVETCEIVGVYENIACVDDWHWVINIMTVQVETLDTLVNKEPDKHPTIEKPGILEFQDMIESRVWTPGLQEALRRYYFAVAHSIQRNLTESVKQ